MNDHADLRIRFEDAASTLIAAAAMFSERRISEALLLRALSLASAAQVALEDYEREHGIDAARLKTPRDVALIVERSMPANAR